MNEEHTPLRQQGLAPRLEKESGNRYAGDLPAADSQQPTAMQARQQAQQSTAVSCHNCGTLNDMEAQYCSSCGAPLHGMTCPNCGSEIDADSDFCEICHHYIRRDVCSFCGASLGGSDGYCPECGSPRGGIVCPTCHTLNDFSFCKQCGQPLTEEARQLQEKVRQMPEYMELTALAQEYSEMLMELPYENERDRRRDEVSRQLRERVLRLLAEDTGEEKPVIPAPRKQRVSREELEARKKRKMEQLSELLDRMAMPPSPSAVKARNYAMAQKPMGVRLAWQCNYKHALHSGPCGCAKPQLGGKWVMLGHNTSQEIKDDK